MRGSPGAPGPPACWIKEHVTSLLESPEPAKRCCLSHIGLDQVLVLVLDLVQVLVLVLDLDLDQDSA